ncbi:TPA: DNA cytosine methyltransferase, partial [Streptococcus suis]|nr:DNA cytosine methyltransferase [Streptococcus suis]
NTRVDGIVGGPPCQAFSTIGRAVNEKKKKEDERIYLYKYYLDFLAKYRPKFFIFENVKGLLSFKDIDEELLFPKIVAEFQGYGYEVEFRILNSSHFGVSQNRERLFLFGLRRDIPVVSGFFNELEKYFEDPINIDSLLKDLPFIKAGEYSNSYRAVRISKFKRKYYRDTKENIPLTYHVARPNIERDLEIYKLVVDEKRKGNNLKYSDLPSKLVTHSNTDAFLDRFKALDSKGISHTIVAHISKDGHYYIHPNRDQNRSISVREAARIQGFPDNFYFESSRTAAFKQIGNAVPPILSKKIAEAIIDMGI